MQITARVSDVELQEAVTSVKLPDLYGCRSKLAIYQLYESKGFKIKSTIAGGIQFEGTITINYDISEMVTTITQEITLK